MPTHAELVAEAQLTVLHAFDHFWPWVPALGLTPEAGMTITYFAFS